MGYCLFDRSDHHTLVKADRKALKERRGKRRRIMMDAKELSPMHTSGHTERARTALNLVGCPSEHRIGLQDLKVTSYDRVCLKTP